MLTSSNITLQESWRQTDKTRKGGRVRNRKQWKQTRKQAGKKRVQKHHVVHQRKHQLLISGGSCVTLFIWHIEDCMVRVKIVGMGTGFIEIPQDQMKDLVELRGQLQASLPSSYQI